MTPVFAYNLFLTQAQTWLTACPAAQSGHSQPLSPRSTAPISLKMHESSLASRPACKVGPKHSTAVEEEKEEKEEVGGGGGGNRGGMPWVKWAEVC